MFFLLSFKNLLMVENTKVIRLNFWKYGRVYLQLR